MSDIDIRVVGRAGRITLCRPNALNAVTHDMVRAIASALPRLAEDPEVDLVVIDAKGDRAFSAGGDIAGIYADLTSGRFDAARQFWRDEYPVNAAIAVFPKPVLSFMQGFTMGGGVGIGCHAGIRVVGDTSRIAMPECGIGLVPDVGGSMLLAHAPGHVGEYLGLTGARMGPGDALMAGFADLYIPENRWSALIGRLEATGEPDVVAEASKEPPATKIDRALCDAHFGRNKVAEIVASLEEADGDWEAEALGALYRNAPLSMAAALSLIRAARAGGTIGDALKREYRFVHRIVEQGDFREGIRAAVIDKDRKPRWRHKTHDAVSQDEVAAMLAPLDELELKLTEGSR